jgi:hypothetical protein
LYLILQTPFSHVGYKSFSISFFQMS